MRYENRFLQVKRQSHHHAPAKRKVAVCEWENGRFEIRYRGQKVLWAEIAERPQPAGAGQPHPVARPYGGTPPTASHPWKQRYDGMKVRGPVVLPSAEAPIAQAAPYAPP